MTTISNPPVSNAGSSVDAALDRLTTDLDGRLVRPGDPTWDDDRRAWQLAVDQRVQLLLAHG